MKVTYFCFNANRFKILVDKPSKPKQSETTSAESGAMPKQSQIFATLYKLTEELLHRRSRVLNRYFRMFVDCLFLENVDRPRCCC